MACRSLLQILLIPHTPPRQQHTWIELLWGIVGQWDSNGQYFGMALASAVLLHFSNHTSVPSRPAPTIPTINKTTGHQLKWVSVTTNATDQATKQPSCPSNNPTNIERTNIERTSIERSNKSEATTNIETISEEIYAQRALANTFANMAILFSRLRSAPLPSLLPSAGWLVGWLVD